MANSKSNKMKRDILETQARLQDSREVYFHTHNKKYCITLTENHIQKMYYFHDQHEAQRRRDEFFRKQFENGYVRLGANNLEIRNILCREGFVVGIWYKQPQGGAECFEIAMTDVKLRHQKSIPANGAEEAYANLCYKYCAHCMLTPNHLIVMMEAGIRYMKHIGVAHTKHAMTERLNHYLNLLDGAYAH